MQFFISRVRNDETTKRNVFSFYYTYANIHTCVYVCKFLNLDAYTINITFTSTID